MKLNGRNISDPWICGQKILEQFKDVPNITIAYKITHHGMLVSLRNKDISIRRKFSNEELTQMIPSVAEKVGKLLAEEFSVRWRGYVRNCEVKK